MISGTEKKNSEVAVNLGGKVESSVTPNPPFQVPPRRSSSLGVPSISTVVPSTPVGETPDAILKLQSEAMQSMSDLSPGSQPISPIVEHIPTVTPDHIDTTAKKPIVPQNPAIPKPATHYTRSQLKPSKPTTVIPAHEAKDDDEEEQQNLNQFIQMIKSSSKQETSLNDTGTVADLHKTVEELQKRLEYETKLKESLQKELEQQKLQERKMKEQLETEINALKSQNFIIQSKLQETASYRDRIVHGGQIIEIASKDELTKIQREILEQESLISGYQKENERLVQEAKDATMKLKEAEALLFKETQKLKLELSQLHEEHNKKVQEVKAKAMASEAVTRVKQLEEEIQQIKEHAQTKDQELKEEIEQLRHAKRILEGKTAGVDVTQLQIDTATSKQLQLQIEKMKEDHQQEKRSWLQKIEFFTQNQELLQEKEKLIQEQATKIHALSEQLAKAKSVLPSQENKRIKELERQLQNFALQDRNPNSLSSLIRATKEENIIIRQQQDKLNMLEKEKLEKEAEHEASIRSLRQEYEKTKVAYEKKIEQMTQQAKSHHPPPNTSRIKELEAQIEETRNFYRKKMKQLEAQVKQKTKGLPPSAPTESTVDPDMPQILKQKQDEIVALQEQLAVTEHKLRDHVARVHDLERELSKRASQQAPAPLPASHTEELLDKHARLLEEIASLKAKLTASETARSTVQQETIDILRHSHVEYLEKIKQMKSMQGKELQDIIQNYQRDIDKYKNLQDLRNATSLQQDHLIIKLQKDVEDANSKVAKLQLKKATLKEKLHLFEPSMNNEKQRIQHLQKALESSQSLIAQLKEKVSLLELELEHAHTSTELTHQLQIDIKTALHDNLELSEKVKLLDQQLTNSEAHKAPVPNKLVIAHIRKGRNSYLILESKLCELEWRHAKKTQEQERLIDSLTHILRQEQDKFNQVVEQKNAEIQRFRMELDDLLDALLAHSQQQGVDK